jgi:glyoxylase-like metal-dependent hydrolase (beta-lactamase superfamily II)
MRIHHLNCGCMCPLGGRLMDGVSRGPTATLVCHCLLVETDRGLVLVDTGFGMRDVERPHERLSPFFLYFNNIQLDPHHTALGQVRSLGFDPADVRHIVLTHLDFDHAGGLEDFPNAAVHVLRAEFDAARARKGIVAAGRYRPEQWDEVKAWRLHRPRGERWFGFESVRDLPGLPPEILMIPLPGHTAGHAGVAIDTPEGWLLNAGDAYFYRHEMDPKPRTTPGLAGYQRLMEVDREARLSNLERLRRLANGGTGIRIFCSHDAVELEALSRLSAGPMPMHRPPVREERRVARR